MTIRWDAYFIDSWDSERYRLYVDNVLEFNEAWSHGSASYDYCGGSWDDRIVAKTIGSIAHTANTLTLKFTSTLDDSSDDESFGFKNILISVWPVCHAACENCFGNTISECWSCKDGWYLKGSTCVLDCGNGYWNNPTGNVCKGKFVLILHTLIALEFHFRMRFNLL